LLARRVLTKLGLADTFEGTVEPDGTYSLVEPEEGRRPFKCFLDLGLRRATTGARVFAAMKGASDGGIFIPHSETRFPGYDAESKSLDSEVLRSYIYGGHVADYMRHLQEEDEEKYRRQFSKYIAAGITADDLEGLYQKVHENIRADPSFVPTKKNPEAYKQFKKFRQQRLTLKERRARIAQKKAEFLKSLA
jgi:large subunit ribosomal protein L5e